MSPNVRTGSQQSHIQWWGEPIRESMEVPYLREGEDPPSMPLTRPSITEFQVNLESVPVHDGCSWNNALQGGSLWLNQEGDADTC